MEGDQKSCEIVSLRGNRDHEITVCVVRNRIFRRFDAHYAISADEAKSQQMENGGPTHLDKFAAFGVLLELRVCAIWGVLRACVIECERGRIGAGVEQAPFNEEKRHLAGLVIRSSDRIAHTTKDVASIQRNREVSPAEASEPGPRHAEIASHAVRCATLPL